MIFLRAAIVKDLTRQLRDRWSLLLWIGIPVFIGAALSSIAGGGDGPKPVAELLLVDEDDTLLSGLVAGAFGQGPLAELVTVQALSLEEGRRRIDAGEGSALLVIPSGFSDSVLNETDLELTLLTNPAQQILPGIIEEGLSVMVDGTFYIQRVFGEQIREIVAMTEQPSDVDVAAISVAFNQAVNGLADHLFPPAIALEQVKQESAEPSNRPSFGLLFFPSTLLMALLFVSQGLSSDLWRERELGTLRRLAGSPQGLTKFLVGKILAAALIIALICSALLVIGFAYHGISWAKYPLSLLWLVLSGLVLYLFFAAIQINLPTRTSANLVSNFLVFPLMMLGGSFFPFEAMPGWMVAIGRWTPNGLMLEQFKLYILDQQDLRRMAVLSAALVGSGILLFAVCSVRNRRTFARA